MQRWQALMLPTLTVLIAAPVAVWAWDRGTVERFATLPPGEKHPEGIEVDQDGTVYRICGDDGSEQSGCECGHALRVRLTRQAFTACVHCRLNEAAARCAPPRYR